MEKYYVNPNIEEAKTLPSSFYKSSETFSNIKDNIFLKCWHFIGDENSLIPLTKSAYPFILLDNLISGPVTMISKLTELIHFNKNKPENMNMYIPSRKQKFIKVFKKNQWMLEKKHERIPDLVDRNYNILDSYYEDCGGSDKLNKKLNQNYKNYQKLIDEKNEKAIKQEYDLCELEILNSSDMVMNQHNIPH